VFDTRNLFRRIRAPLRVFPAMIAATMLPASPSGAHHSPVAFDTSIEDFTISGRIESVDVRNPHSVMELNVVNDDGTEILWHIEFSSINLLLRRGWDFDRLIPGEEVSCTGNPGASGKNEMYMWSIVLDDGTEFSR
jgi:hypothetical protein